MNSVLRTEGATAAAAAAEATLGTSKQLWKRMEFLFFLFFNGIPIRRKPHRPFMYVAVGRRRRISLGFPFSTNPDVLQQEGGPARENKKKKKGK